MRMRIAAVLILAAMGGVAYAQQAGLPEPSPLEKSLAARASDVTEVTLSKQMLGFAGKFMKDKDDEESRQLIQNLDGIYVRSYEFEKEGEVTPEEVEQLRAHYETGEWTPMVRSRERKDRETTDVMMKMVNGESRGLLVLASEPRELTIVLILGPIKPEELGKLKGIGGLGALGSVSKNAKTKSKLDQTDNTGTNPKEQP
jgi:Domain of unknown function (DUF4252)